MAYGNFKSLATVNFQLPSSVGTIYTAPIGKKAEIGTIIYHNTNTSAETIKLYARGTTTAHRRDCVVLQANATYEFSPKLPLVLNGGETLSGETTTASKVNVEVIGREEI